MRRSLVISLAAVIGVAVLGLGATIVAGNHPLLGLDLQGGASLVLKPQATVSSGVLEQAISIIRKRVDALGVAEPDISRQGTNVVIELPGIKNPQAALNVVGQTAELRFRPVLCTIGPAQKLTPAPSTTTTPTTSPSTPGTTTKPAAGKTTSTTAHALGPINSGGTADLRGVQLAASVGPASAGQPAGAGQPANAGLPAGAGRPAEGLLAQTATTTAPKTTPGTASTATTLAPATATTPTTAPAPTSLAQAVQQACTAAVSNGGGALPTTLAKDDPSPSPSPTQCAQSATDLPGCYVILPDAQSTSSARYILGPTELTGSIVRTATAVPPQVGGDWSVQVNFTGSGSPKFDAMAAKYVQKQVAIVLDGLVESAPTIQTATFNGTASITGTFSEAQANNLSLELRYGSLPVQFAPQSIQTVSATLGKDSLRAGLLAGGIGLVLVLVYMILYYRALGLVVVLGLSLSGMLLYTIVSTLSQSSGLALSLAGATGIIVSVGVTADSYIVYFERLKDEIRSGKTVRSSVDRGFVRAYRTIVAADLVSILAAGILYVFTVSSVRGFAFFLGLSTILDLITAYLFTRPMVVLLGRSRTFTEARFLGVARGLAVSPSGGQA